MFVMNGTCRVEVLEHSIELEKGGYRGIARQQVKSVDQMRQDRDAANKNAGASDKGKERAKA